MTHEEIAQLAQNFKLCMVLVGVGIALSLVKKLYDLEQTGTILKPTAYWMRNPYSILLCVMSAYTLACFWFFMGLLNAPLAILTGVASDYAFDTLRAKAAGRMKDNGENSGT